MESKILQNKLYIVPTPIGNLEDITLRAINTLKNVDYILAEDTRHSLKLLNHFKISKKLVSYYKDVEAKKIEKIIRDLKNGVKIALISDAGTPGISDPGMLLISEAIKENIPIETLPGACAMIPAIVSSGFDTTHFTFYGFLPHLRSNNKIKEILKAIMESTFPVILYESPFRIKNTLKLISEIDNNRNVVVAKELTKIHEEFLRGKAVDLIDLINPKGEFVLIIDKKDTTKETNKTPDPYILFDEYISLGISKNEAIKKIAKKLNVAKNDIYQLFLDK